MKVWITKYALTQGVYQDDVKIVGRGYAYSGGQCIREWVRTEEEARAAWEAARRAKVASLKRQIAKLEAMDFKVRR